MDILAIIKDNLPDGVEIPEKTLKTIEKEIKAEQGKEFIPKEQYSKKTERIDELEKEVKELSGSSADAETYKTKYEDEVKAHAETKSTIEKERIISNKRTALQGHLKADGANPKLINLLEREFDLASIELDGDKIKGWDELAKPIKEQYAEVFGTVSTTGAEVGNPPSTQSGNNYVAQLDAARKAGNTQEAVRIKTEAANEGISLI